MAIVRVRVVVFVPPSGTDEGLKAADIVSGANTAIVPDVPAGLPPVSAAVMVWFPFAFRVAEKVPVLPAMTEFAGSTAAPSVLVKCSVPL